MIPERIVEAAVRGGWKSPAHFGVFPKEEQIVLDPTFWQALGKALGWKRFEKGKTPKECYLFTCSSCGQECGGHEEWLDVASRFYDLLLTQAPQEQLDAFWEELLSVSN